MNAEHKDIRATLGSARIFTFNNRHIMQWPGDICRRYGIDESVVFDIQHDDGGFRLVLKRKEGTL